MAEIFSRNELYWGKDFQNYLKNLKISVFGLGGVGGFALEALSRAGVENFLIVDFDTVSKTNINRQIIALHSTLNRKKAEVFKQRLLDINPEIKIKIYDGFYSKDVEKDIFTEDYQTPDFVIDAIDTLKSKIELISYCKENNLEIISSMGAGNRLDATKLYISDISKIKTKDSFTKNVISKLKKYAGIENGLTVVSSSEKAHSKEKIKNVEKILLKDGNEIEVTKFTPASTPVVPAVAGYLIANHILTSCYNNFLNNKPQKA